MTFLQASKAALLSIAVIWGFIMIPGCSQTVEVRQDPFFDEWKAKAESSRAHSPSAKPRIIDLPERQEKVVSAEKIKIEPEKPLPKDKVTMNMRNTDVNVVLRALALTAGQNIMMNEGVSGVTNINVKGTPWDQVFKGILRTRGLTYTWEGDIIRVMTLQDMQHDRKIEEVLQQQKSQSLELKKVEPLLTRIIRIDYADATSLGANLEKMLTSEGEKDAKRGSVTVDEHNNSLIIQAIRDDIARMITLVEELDRPTSQILIEANIVETTRDTARELGVQWGGLYRGSSGGGHWITPGANSSGVLGGSLSTPIEPTSGFISSAPSDVLSNSAGLTLGIVGENIGDYILNVQLSALQEEGKINILSSPSITTLDNQMAFTENGEKIPYVSTDIDGNRQINFEDAVLRLEIKPHVIDGKNLKMDIKIKKDEVDTSRSVDGNPFIIKKQTETVLIVQDGETVVISGLTKKKNTDAESGVPDVKDIPVLGYLFKGEKKTDQMEEVLIFLTPHILKERAKQES